MPNYVNPEGNPPKDLDVKDPIRHLKTPLSIIREGTPTSPLLLVELTAHTSMKHHHSNG